MQSRRSGQLVLIVYPATIAGGAVRASEESEAVAFFAPDALPELDFPKEFQGDLARLKALLESQS